MIAVFPRGVLDMNDFSHLFVNVRDDSSVVLEKDRVYHVRQDDSFEMTGYFCTNTAKKRENPDGLRRSAIFLKNKKNITIDGNGASLIIHGKMTPFLFDECENITVKNLTVDYACPTMTEFRIVSNDGGNCVISINPDCRYRIEDGRLIWQGENDRNGNPYWESGYTDNGRYIKIFDPEKKRSYDFSRADLEFDSIVKINETTLRVHLKNENAFFPAGCIVQTRSIVRDQTGSLFQRSRNLSFENLRVKFMHGLGMVSQFCENVSYINCDFTPADGRTIASTADFFQFSGCKGKIVVDRCKAWGAHDDYVNVHGTHLRIMETNEEEKSIVVRFMHNESWGFQAFEKGDILDFIRWDTLIPYDSANVVDYKKINDTDIKLYVDNIPGGIVSGKDVVENASWTPDLYVGNCEFGTTSGRGILCTTRGEVIIENNTFFNVWGPALLVEDDCNFWFESGYTNEIIFRNNRVVGCEYAKMHESAAAIRYTPKVMDETSSRFVHGRLTLTGNTFEKPTLGKHCIWLEYLKEAEISGNTFDAEYEIKTHVTGSVADSNNKIK